MGDNPNCFRCWGTGLIESKSKPANAGPIGKSKNASPKAKPQLLKCPDCGAEVVKLQRHMRRMHGVDLSGPADVSASNCESHPNLVRAAEVCVQCGVTVKNLQRHIRKTGHTTELSLPSPGKVRSTENRRLIYKAMFECQYCKLVLPNQNQLISHVIGAHGKKAVSKMLQKTSPPAVARKKKNQFDTVELQKVFNPTNDSDATKGWGHTYRDNGQFGSYPLHDAMDDESAP